ncbi:MAG: hypothetical protein H0W41_05735, partial [Chloroflexi bacterium]|nr:hypothetical protein [Chloroflexota bacterium]
TNKVELADIDADGFVDLLFANGGDYDTPGTPVASRAFSTTATARSPMPPKRYWATSSSSRA